ncbi:MAG: coproporphyrinogen III oxidase [Micavibrio sp.]|nr:MAG: coproporphyrinogen III oxidase [Micavibrio sp.]
MIRKTLIAALFITICSFYPQNLQAQESPVVVELFTSQSCSSCPAADKALAELVRENKNIIALSCHVTYWNHLRWKDTLSKPECSRRQREYAIALGNGKRVYTPQMVVNGENGFVGSHRKEAKKAIANAGSITPISLSKQDSKTLMADLPELPAKLYRLISFGYKNNHTENIKGGENGGKILRSTNAVVYAGPAESWDGSAKMKGIMIPNNNDIDGVIVLVQSAQTGTVVSAGQILLN